MRIWEHVILLRACSLASVGSHCNATQPNFSFCSDIDELDQFDLLVNIRERITELIFLFFHSINVLKWSEAIVFDSFNFVFWSNEHNKKKISINNNKSPACCSDSVYSFVSNDENSVLHWSSRFYALRTHRFIFNKNQLFAPISTSLPPVTICISGAVAFSLHWIDPIEWQRSHRIEIFSSIRWCNKLLSLFVVVSCRWLNGSFMLLPHWRHGYVLDRVWIWKIFDADKSIEITLVMVKMLNRLISSFSSWKFG